MTKVYNVVEVHFKQIDGEWRQTGQLIGWAALSRAVAEREVCRYRAELKDLGYIDITGQDILVDPYQKDNGVDILIIEAELLESPLELLAGQAE